jgi:transcription initiation factor TFIIE subunit alpha
MDVIVERKKRILEDLNNKLEYEVNTVFFECMNDHFRIPYDIASERGFRCPQCEGSLEYINNQKTVESLEREISRLQDELGASISEPLKTARLQ